MRKGIGNPLRREALFGGVGELLIWDLLGETPLPPFDAVFACELAAGGWIGTFQQESHTEIIVVTDGQGTAILNSEAIGIGVGSLIRLDLGSTLSISNESNQNPLRYLVIKAAADCDRS